MSVWCTANVRIYLITEYWASGSVTYYLFKVNLFRESPLSLVAGAFAHIHTPLHYATLLLPHCVRSKQMSPLFVNCKMVY